MSFEPVKSARAVTNIFMKRYCGRELVGIERRESTVPSRGVVRPVEDCKSYQRAVVGLAGL